MLAFSPRKIVLTLYVYSDTEKSKQLLPNLGKYIKSKACIYIKRQADTDTAFLEELCKESIAFISERHQCLYHI